MSFGTAITCLDGRIHIPVIRYLQKRFDVDYVDLASEAGPNLLLALDRDTHAIESILRRVTVSLQYHDSKGIAVVGHHDCAGNPASASEQHRHTAIAVQRTQARFPHIEVIGLWVNENGTVTER